MFCALESHYFWNLMGLCSHSTLPLYHHTLPHQCFSLEQYGPLMVSSSAFREGWGKESALWFGWRRGRQGRSFVCVYSYSTEPKLPIMGHICEFTPADSAFPGVYMCKLLIRALKSSLHLFHPTRGTSSSGHLAAGSGWRGMPHPTVPAPCRGCWGSRRWAGCEV